MKDAYSAPPGARARATAQDKPDAIEKKLLEKLIKLPLIPKPLGDYLPINKVGKIAYVSGQLPIKDGTIGIFKGRLGKEITLEIGQRAAQWCTFNALAHLKRDLGSLEKIKRVIKLTGYVAGMPGFHQQPEVLNGASKILIELFGDAGKHSRVAVGVTDLPKGACCEIEYVFELK